MDEWIVEGKLEKNEFQRLIDYILGNKVSVNVTLTRGKKGDTNHTVISAFDTPTLHPGIEMTVVTRGAEKNHHGIMDVIRSHRIDGSHFSYCIDGTRYPYDKI